MPSPVPAATPASARLGYARVSTDDQNLDLQRDALAQAGCRQVYEEKASGKGADRPELDHVLADLRPGDTLVVWGVVQIRVTRETWNPLVDAALAAFGVTRKPPVLKHACSVMCNHAGWNAGRVAYWHLAKHEQHSA